MKKLYNLARGTVRLEVSGAEPELLLNKLCEKSIEFWDTKSCDDFSMQISVHSSDLAEIRSSARKNGCDIKIIESKGGKAITRSAKRRFALLIGLAVCIIIASFSSLFIWNITVTGNKSLSYGEILRVLREGGVEYGVFWPAISAEDVKNKVLMSCPEISWLSLNMNNSELEVTVHERIEKPDIIAEAEPCSIYAQKSGIVTKISVLQGKSVINIGDTVCEGDMLISGLMDSETGDDREVHAMGEVTARTWYEITAVSPLTECVKTDSGGGSVKIGLLAGKNYINFYSDSRNNELSCDKINKLRYISLGKSYVIPIGMAIISGKTFETKDRAVDTERLQLRMQDNLLEELRHRIGEGEIVSSNFSVSECDGLLVVTLRAECIENIA